MKFAHIFTLILIATILSSCGTIDNGRTFHRGGAVDFFTEQPEENTYYLEVKGAGIHSKETVIDIWKERAIEVADGRKHEVKYTTEGYTYSGYGGMAGTIGHSAYITKGTVVIIDNESQ